MMTQEIAKILMEEWLSEWLHTLDTVDLEEAWNTEFYLGQEMVQKFLKWMEETK